MTLETLDRKSFLSEPKKDDSKEWNPTTTSVRMKIQYQVADAFRVPKSEQPQWFSNNGEVMSDVINSPQFKAFMDDRDWDSALQLLIDAVIQRLTEQR